MELSRYAVTDAYTLEEMRREFQNSDAKGRIRLLEKLYEGEGAPPYEIALLAVEDPNVEVRQWIARNGRGLDYRDVGFRRSEATEALIELRKELTIRPDDSSPLNLADRLKNDPDPYVRACLRENSKIYGSFGFIGRWKDFFKDASHLERLALVRNPTVYEELIEKIFDPEDKELGIELEERKELAFAFLTNKEVLAKNWANAKIEEGSAAGFPLYDGSSWYSADKFLRKLWESASTWPNESGVPYMVYQCVPALDDVKAQTYQKCDEAALRRVILEHCSRDDADTIQLGVKDTDEACRFSACTKVRYLDGETLETLIKGEDVKGALWGLAANRSLSVAQLEKVRDRLGKLENHSGVEWAEETIREVQKAGRQAEKARPPKDPEELFGPEGREGNFLEDKIDFIGKRLLSIEQELAQKLTAMQQLSRTVRTVQIVIAIAIGVILFRWLFM